MNLHTVTSDCGRYSLQYEHDHGDIYPARWFQNGFAVPELPIEIEDELLDLALAEERTRGVDEAVDEALDREMFDGN